MQIAQFLFVLAGQILISHRIKGSVEHASPDLQLKIEQIFKYIDDNQAEFIEDLKKAIAIPNVSAWNNQRSTYMNLLKMINFAKGKLTSLGFSVDLRPVGKPQTMDDGLTEPLPPVIFATLGSSSADKETLLIYSHLDVQPAKQSDGWDSDPFVLTSRNGNLYGRGATDDKGPFLGWVHAIQAFIQNSIELPINIKFILESGEEVGSVGLEDLLKEEVGGFLANISTVAISDNNWVGQNVPCLTHGLRGHLPFKLVVQGGTKDLHSGYHGGAVVEPMNDLVWILSQLQDSRGKILIPGIIRGVDPINHEGREYSSYKNLDFSLENYKNGTGGPSLIYPGSKEDTLAALWLSPSLSIHGIAGAFSDPGVKSVIPGRVVGKFSIRIVPHQDPAIVGAAVEAFLASKWQERGSPNKFEIKPQKTSRPWFGDTNNKNFRAAAAAIRKVYGKEPQYTRNGGTIPITILLEEVTGGNVVLIPMGQSEDGAHGQNERISLRNYIQGTKVFAAYFMQLANQRV